MSAAGNRGLAFAAAGIALINTAGNFAGFAAGYITGTLKDWTGIYVVPMFLVGGFMSRSVRRLTGSGDLREI